MTREPMFNISERMPLWLVGAIVAVHALVSYAPDLIKTILLNLGVLVPLGTAGRTELGQGGSLVFHGFLHADWGHLLMNSAMIVAFGVVTIRGIRLKAASKGVRAKGEFCFLGLFLLGVVGGGLAQWAWWALSGTSGAAIGASGGASALFASAAWAMGGRQKLISFGFGWAVINVVMVLAEPILGIKLAWAAHMGGYIAGAIFAPLWVRANSTGFSVTG